MGAIISLQNGNKNDTHNGNSPQRKLQGRGTVDPLIQGRKLSWFTAGETTSTDLMGYNGNVWCDSSKDYGTRPDTYENITEKMGRSMLKEKLQQLSQKHNSAASKKNTNGGQGSISFYGYSYNDGRQTISTESRLNLADHREILGVANLQGPLAWYLIGKNCIDSPDEVCSPCMVFARPEYVIIRFTVDNVEVGNIRCPGSGPPCFLSLPIKDYDELMQLKKFPIYLTHVDRMNIGQPEPYTSACTEGFSEVLRNLSPGAHHCHMALQFAYKTSKVTIVGLKEVDPSYSPRLKKNSSDAKEAFDFSLRQTVRNSSLVLRHSNPSKMILSPPLCSGQFSIVLPEVRSFDSLDYSSFQSLGTCGSSLDGPVRDNRVKKKKQKAKRRRFSSG